MEGKREKGKNPPLRMADYEISSLLGSGSFGKVKLARRKKDNTVLCVKTMKKAAII